MTGLLLLVACADEPEDSGGDSGADTGAAAVLSAEITDLQLSANCMPAVPEDPIVASWTLTVHNAGAADGVLRVEAGTLSTATAVQHIGVEPAEVAVAAGATESVGQSKTGDLGDSDPDVEPLLDDCSLCDSTLRLELDLGSSGSASAEATLSCVY